ncbi:hypothetical protein CSB07_01160 [Candidatus Gracilibacteria bacterium]|nr:MAG: hypothetical protein CSB07_01160 [Candidatus Gracilibacteria bacterium]PIE85603.1 MAG: hypothetical protein CSA08_01185 [Candidatus Gracilibacteria bacterium]
MKFYNRKKEIEILAKRISSKNFEFIYLLGKRRVGKTELINHLNKNILKKDFLYIFTERSNLINFLKKQENYIFERTGIKYNFETIEDFLDFFFLQKKYKILVIDEFQNFNFIDKSIFSIFQKKIDEYQNKSKNKVIVLGSIQSMMIKIFENAKEPLYKRSTFNLFLKEFNLETQIKILKDIFGKNYNHKILLDIYSIFGGTAYYLKALFKENYKKYDLKIIFRDLFFSEFAILRNEGKEILIEEFGQKYKRFFAILEAISKGQNKRSEIINVVGLGTGEIDIYLKDLAEIYSIIEIKSPILEKKGNVTRYFITDNFLNFWFRYIYSNKSKYELGLYDLILENSINDFEKFKGFKFEKLVKEFLILENKKGKLDFTFTEIGTWLDRKNNEVDLVYTDEKENIVFLECKLNEKRINKSEESQLKSNVGLFLNKHEIFKNKNIKIGFAIFDEEKLIKFKYI